MATIHLIGGEKGGVGKSWVARVMVQYFLDGGVSIDPTHSNQPIAPFPFVAVECDRSNPTLSNIYGDYTQQIVFSENPDLEDLADPIFEFGIERSVVVNLPAQVHRPLRDWIRKKKLIEMGQQFQVNFVHWFVCDGEDDSINLFIQSVQELGDGIPHVLVKNQGRCDDWTYFDHYQPEPEAIQAAAANQTELPLSLSQAIERYQVKVIDFPKLSTLKRIPINAKRMTFAQARQHSDFGILGRNQIVVYLREAYQAFESTGYLPYWTLVEPTPTPIAQVPPPEESVVAPAVETPAITPTSSTRKSSRKAKAQPVAEVAPEPIAGGS